MTGATDGSARDRLTASLIDRLGADERFRALWFTGSLARGEADEYSDVDLLAVVDDATYDAVLAGWPDIVAAFTPLVYTKRIGGGRRVVINHVTPDWTRFDVTITVPAEVDRQPRNLVRPIFDRDDLGRRLAAAREPLAPDPGVIVSVTQEFLRVLGLAPVVIGRGDLLVAVSGCLLLRQLLIELMLQDVAVPDRGGALHLSRLLPSERREQLTGLPALTADLSSVLAWHADLTALFLPLARDLHRRLGLDWPEDFARAALGRLVQVGVRVSETG